MVGCPSSFSHPFSSVFLPSLHGVSKATGNRVGLIWRSRTAQLAHPIRGEQAQQMNTWHKSLFHVTTLIPADRSFVLNSSNSECSQLAGKPSRKSKVVLIFLSRPKPRPHNKCYNPLISLRPPPSHASPRHENQPNSQPPCLHLPPHQCQLLG